MILFGIPLQTLLFALIGGIVPAVVWLVFWLREDGEKREPAGLLFLTFLAGMISVFIVLPFENILYNTFYLSSEITIPGAAFIEEIAKFILVAAVAFRTRFIDEPTDYALYMITGALGFAAMENALFLLDPLLSNDLAITFFTSNLRFLGATVLHVVSSAVIGVSMGLAFNKLRLLKNVHLVVGILTAGALHSLFNFFIIKGTMQSIITIFGVVWVAAVIILLLFEKLKRMEYHAKRNTPFITH